MGGYMTDEVTALLGLYRVRPVVNLKMILMTFLSGPPSYKVCLRLNAQ